MEQRDSEEGKLRRVERISTAVAIHVAGRVRFARVRDMEGETGSVPLNCTRRKSLSLSFPLSLSLPLYEKRRKGKEKADFGNKPSGTTFLL